MRIFYVNVIEQNAGWGAEWFMNKAFRALGHTTYCVDYRENRHRLFRYFLNAPDCDAFLLQRGDFFPIPLIQSIQIPRFFWASELVSRCRDQDRLLRSGLFDHFFFHTNDCIERVVARGWVDRSRCSVLLNGFDETVFRLTPNTPKDIDILFVGATTSRRKAVIEKIRQRFNLSTPSAFVSVEELVNLFNRAKIILNIHAEEFLDTETRVFEALGCGAFLLTERLSPENPFSQNELIEFDGVRDLCDKLQYFLTHDEERNKIAERGHAAALRSHTYTHRAQEIVKIMSAYMGARSELCGRTVRRNWRLHAFGMSEPFLRLGESLSGRTKYSLSKVRQFVGNSMKRTR